MTVNPYQKSPTSPAVDFAAVTPSDSVDLGQPCRALWVGTGGHVSCVSLNGASVLFKNAPSGWPLPVIARRINATGTTAADLVALY